MYSIYTIVVPIKGIWGLVNFVLIKGKGLRMLHDMYISVIAGVEPWAIDPFNRIMAH